MDVAVSIKLAMCRRSSYKWSATSAQSSRKLQKSREKNLKYSGAHCACAVFSLVVRNWRILVSPWERIHSCRRIFFLFRAGCLVRRQKSGRMNGRHAEIIPVAMMVDARLWAHVKYWIESLFSLRVNDGCRTKMSFFQQITSTPLRQSTITLMAGRGMLDVGRLQKWNSNLCLR